MLPSLRLYSGVASAGGASPPTIKMRKAGGDQPPAGSRDGKMYFVYVLKSLRNGKRYVGYTSKLPVQRVGEHNAGTNKFTSRIKPLELAYSEKFYDKAEVLKREKFLKSGQGRKFLDSIIPG